MANRVLSIEVSQSITRVIEMDYKVKSPKIYNFFSFETPKNVLDEGSVKVTDSFLSSMKAGIKSKGIHTNKVVFTITSGRIANREVMIPQIKQSKIKNLITANAQEYFPVDLSKYQVQYIIADKVEMKGQKNYKLVVYAIPVDIIESYKALAKALGFLIETMDYVGNSVVEAMRKEVSNESVAVIKVEEEVTLMTVFHQGKVEFQRSIAYGINEAMEQLQRVGVYGENLTYTDAMNIMRRKCCIRRHLDVEADYREEEDVELDIAAARASITESLRPLVSNCVRVLDFFGSRHKEIHIDKIILIGLGADFSGLSKLLTNELSIKTISLQKLTTTTLYKRTDEDTFRVAEYIACIGAACHPLEIDCSSVKRESKKQTETSLILPSFVFVVCIAASVAMIVVPMLQQQVLKKKVWDRTNEKLKLSYIEDIYNTYESTAREYNDFDAMYATTKTPNEELVSFIEEMEQRMPSDIKVVSLTADISGVNMNIKVNSKASAAKVLVELRSFETLSQVHTSGIAEVTDELGSSFVELSVSCAYKLVEPTEKIEDKVEE